MTGFTTLTNIAGQPVEFNTKGYSDDDVTDQAVFFKNLTRNEYEALNRWARVNTERAEYCGCAHDCCGHLVATYAKFRYNRKLGLVRLTYNQSFNY